MWLVCEDHFVENDRDSIVYGVMMDIKARFEDTFCARGFCPRGFCPRGFMSVSHL